MALRPPSDAAAALDVAAWREGDGGGVLLAPLVAEVEPGGVIAGARVLVAGTITGRRVHGRGLMFCDVLSGGGGVAQQLAVDDRRGALRVMCGDVPSSYATLVPLMSVGARLVASGAPGRTLATRTRAGHPTLFVDALCLLRAAPEPPAVHRVCAMLTAGQLSLDMAAGLLGAAAERTVAAAAALAAGGFAGAHEAVRLARALGGLPEARPTRVRAPRLGRADHGLLGSLAGVRGGWPVTRVGDDGDAAPPPWARLLDPAVCVPDAADSRRAHYVTAKKRPQVLWMVRAVAALFADAAAVAAAPPPRVRIVDVGCGRGDLTIALAAALPAARVLGVDVNVESLRAAEAIAGGGGVSNVRFECMRADDAAAREDGDAGERPGGGDDEWWAAECVIYCSLHACGGLADLTAAMALGRARGAAVAGFICCTCCFCSYGSARTATRTAAAVAAVACVDVARGDGGDGAGAGAEDGDEEDHDASASATCAAPDALVAPPPLPQAADARRRSSSGGGVDGEGAAAAAAAAARGGDGEASGDGSGGGGGGGGGAAWGLSAGDVARLCRLAELEVPAVRDVAMHSVNALRLTAIAGAAAGAARVLRRGALLAMPVEYTPRNLVIRGLVVGNAAGAGAGATTRATDSVTRGDGT